MLLNREVFPNPFSSPLLETISVLRTVPPSPFEIFFLCMKSRAYEIVGILVGGWRNTAVKLKLHFQHELDRLSSTLCFVAYFPEFLSEKDRRFAAGNFVCVCVWGGYIQSRRQKKKNDEALCVVYDGFAPKNVIRTTVSCRGKY